MAANCCLLYGIWESVSLACLGQCDNGAKLAFVFNWKDHESGQAALVLGSFWWQCSYRYLSIVFVSAITTVKKTSHSGCQCLHTQYPNFALRSVELTGEKIRFNTFAQCRHFGCKFNDYIVRFVWRAEIAAINTGPACTPLPDWSNWSRLKYSLAAGQEHFFNVTKIEEGRMWKLCFVFPCGWLTLFSCLTRNLFLLAKAFNSLGWNLMGRASGLARHRSVFLSSSFQYRLTNKQHRQSVDWTEIHQKNPDCSPAIGLPSKFDKKYVHASPFIPSEPHSPTTFAGLGLKCWSIAFQVFTELEFIILQGFIVGQHNFSLLGFLFTVAAVALMASVRKIDTALESWTIQSLPRVSHKRIYIRDARHPERLAKHFCSDLKEIHFDCLLPKLRSRQATPAQLVGRNLWCFFVTCNAWWGTQIFRQF